MTWPPLTDVLSGLGQRVQFALLKKQITDFEVTETVQVVRRFEAVMQPLEPRKLAILPQGQRRWKHWTLWTKEPLQGDDVRQDPQRRQYRIMSIGDWSQAGRSEEH